MRVRFPVRAEGAVAVDLVADLPVLHVVVMGDVGIPHPVGGYLGSGLAGPPRHQLGAGRVAAELDGVGGGLGHRLPGEERIGAGPLGAGRGLGARGGRQELLGRRRRPGGGHRGAHPPRHLDPGAAGFDLALAAVDHELGAPLLGAPGAGLGAAGLVRPRGGARGADDDLHFRRRGSRRGGARVELGLPGLKLDRLALHPLERRARAAEEDERVLRHQQPGAVGEAQLGGGLAGGAHAVALHQHVSRLGVRPRDGRRLLLDLAGQVVDGGRGHGRPHRRDADALSGLDAVGVRERGVEAVQLLPELDRAEEAGGDLLQRLAGADDVPDRLFRRRRRGWRCGRGALGPAPSRREQRHHEASSKGDQSSVHQAALPVGRRRSFAGRLVADRSLQW